MYEEGLVRFATWKYSQNLDYNKNNRFIHLTNYAVNKFNANFIYNKDKNIDNKGSKWSLSALKSYFKSKNIYSDGVFSQI